MESNKNKQEINHQERLPESFLVLPIEFYFYFPESLSESVIL